MTNPSKILFATLAASLFLGACGTSTVDSGDLEVKLAEQLAPQAEVDPADVSVACPDDQEVEAGASFECTLTAPNGDEVRVEVTLTDEEGGFEAVVPPQQF